MSEESRQEAAPGLRRAGEEGRHPTLPLACQAPDPTVRVSQRCRGGLDLNSSSQGLGGGTSGARGLWSVTENPGGAK